MDSDLIIPERTEFHAWYLEKHKEEYPYGYTELFRKATGKEGAKEQVSALRVINKYENSPEFQNSSGETHATSQVLTEELFNETLDAILNDR